MTILYDEAEYLDALVTLELAARMAQREQRPINGAIRACWSAVRPRVTNELNRRIWPDGAITVDAFPYEKGLINFFDKKGEFANDKEPLKLNSNYKPAKIETVTREQYEAALALAQQSVWSGEGLPPVGCECEYQDSNTSKWYPVTIKYISEQLVVICGVTNILGEKQDTEIAKDIICDKPQFRPIRTEAERKREEIINALTDYTLRGEAGDIYWAIAAGKIPGVKLSD